MNKRQRKKLEKRLAGKFYLFTTPRISCGCGARFYGRFEVSRKQFVRSKLQIKAELENRVKDSFKRHRTLCASGFLFIGGSQARARSIPSEEWKGREMKKRQIKKNERKSSLYHFELY